MVEPNPKIVVTEQTKQLLDSIKEHPRETYDDVIVRLIKKVKDNARTNRTQNLYNL